MVIPIWLRAATLNALEQRLTERCQISLRLCRHSLLHREATTVESYLALCAFHMQRSVSWYAYEYFASSYESTSRRQLIVATRRLIKTIARDVRAEESL